MVAVFYPKTPLSLPEIQAITPTTQVVSADEKGFLQTELPLAVLLFSLKNKFVEVKDHKDEGISYNIDGTDTSKQLLLNPNNDKTQTAMINAFTSITAVHNYLTNSVGFSAEILNQSLTAFVNVDYQDCNAKYRNGLVAFFQESEHCRNTAYDTVIYHEYAHFVDDLYGGIKDRSLSEGMGDVLATFLTDQPLIGQELYKKNQAALRSAENKVAFAGTEKSDDPTAATYTAATYDNGQTWSGFACDVRKALIQKYGFSEGKTRATKLFLTPLETNAPSIKSAVAEVFARNARGLDFQLAPDYEILQEAATKHGLL